MGSTRQQKCKVKSDKIYTNSNNICTTSRSSYVKTDNNIGKESNDRSNMFSADHPLFFPQIITKSSYKPLEVTMLLEKKQKTYTNISKIIISSAICKYRDKAKESLDNSSIRNDSKKAMADTCRAVSDMATIPECMIYSNIEENVSLADLLTSDIDIFMGMNNDQASNGTVQNCVLATNFTAKDKNAKRVFTDDGDGYNLSNTRTNNDSFSYTSFLNCLLSPKKNTGCSFQNKFGFNETDYNEQSDFVMSEADFQKEISNYF